MSVIANERDRAKEICSRMQQIRISLPASVKAAKNEVSNLSDWKFYVKSYPLFVLPTVAGLAYWLVPRKPSPVPAVEGKLHVANQKDAVGDPAVKKSYLAGVGSVVAGLAFRALSSYVTNKITSSFHHERYPNTDMDRMARKHESMH